MADKLDRTPVAPFGSECCGADGCEACFRVEFEREVTDEEGNTRTEVYYVPATDEMNEHLKNCEPYQAKLKAQADAQKAAEEAKAEQPTLQTQPATAYDLGNGLRVMVFNDAEGNRQVVPLPEGVGI